MKKVKRDKNHQFTVTELTQFAVTYSKVNSECDYFLSKVKDDLKDRFKGFDGNIEFESIDFSNTHKTITVTYCIKGETYPANRVNKDFSYKIPYKDFAYDLKGFAKKIMKDYEERKKLEQEEC